MDTVGWLEMARGEKETNTEKMLDVGCSPNFLKISGRNMIMVALTEISSSVILRVKTPNKQTS